MDFRPEYKDPSWAVQKETFDRLKNHSLLINYKDKIFDEVDQNQECPYIRVGLFDADDWGARDIAGFTLINTIDIFCDNTTKTGKIECKTLQNLVLRAMTDQILGKLDLSSYGFKNVLQQPSGLRILEESEKGEPKVIRHGIVEIRHIIQVL